MRIRRNSPTLETAQNRLAGLKKITPAPDFGAALSVATYEAEVDGYRLAQEAYNTELAVFDDRQNRLNAREQVLGDLSQRILAAVKAQYGPDSSEFEMVGGTRRSERKHRTTKKKAN
jgi:hypothetical protein